MGAIHFSIDLNLLKTLKELLPLSVFVETGTFEGDSTAKARIFFDELYTVEISPQYYANAAARFKSDSAVRVQHGDSVQFLQGLCPRLSKQSVLYWLDAHWCIAEDAAGETSQCPLIEELEAIHYLNDQSVVLIDDARFFLCPPPLPHEITQWPDLNVLVSKLRSLSASHEIMVVDDTIVYYPPSIRDSLKTYVHEHAIDLLSVVNKSRQHDVLLEQLNQLQQWLKESEADRAARLEQVNQLTQLLQESELDRAAQLKQIDELTQLLRESEADRAARLEQINQLTQLLQESEKDRLARLDQVTQLTQLLRESEADRAARLEQIHQLTALLGKKGGES